MFQKLFKVKDSFGITRFSLTKVAGAIASVTAAVVVAGVCPPAALPAAKVILAVASGLGLIGARDALSGK